MVSSAAILLAAAAAIAAPQQRPGKAEYDKAVRLFEAEEYKAALPWFRKAYALSGKRGSTIIGLAQCERVLEMYDEAIAHFREYLASTPPPPDAPSVKETIAVLEELRAQKAAETAPSKPVEAPKPESPPPPKPEPPKAEPPKAEPPPPAVAPPPAPEPAVAPPASPPAAEAREERPLWKSPVLWILAGAVVAGGGVAVGVALSSGSGAYGGNTDTILSPLSP